MTLPSPIEGLPPEAIEALTPEAMETLPPNALETPTPAGIETSTPAAKGTLPFGSEPESGTNQSPKRSGKRIDGLLATRWGRLLVPSLSDFLFVALLAWLFMSSGAHGWQSLLADADVGWHIRTGEIILDHHQVPHHDLYSFSKPGAPWYAWEWLTDIIDGLLFRWAGLKGIVLA